MGTDSTNQSLAQVTVDEFTTQLGSVAPAPGGGSASALCGALGASLCAMVANLTIGRKRYEAFQTFSEETAAHAEELRKKFLQAVDLDTEVFNRFSEALLLPKDNEEQKLARFATIQNCLYECVESPLLVMHLCQEAILLTEDTIGKSNTSVCSDVGVSALCLKAAVQSAWLNVKINLTSMKDESKRNAYRVEGELLLASVCAIADDCYNRILNSL